MNLSAIIRGGPTCGLVHHRKTRAHIHSDTRHGTSPHKVESVQAGNHIREHPGKRRHASAHTLPGSRRPEPHRHTLREIHSAPRVEPTGALRPHNAQAAAAAAAHLPARCRTLKQIGCMRMQRQSKSSSSSAFSSDSPILHSTRVASGGCGRCYKNSNPEPKLGVAVFKCCPLTTDAAGSDRSADPWSKERRSVPQRQSPQ